MAKAAREILGTETQPVFTRSVVFHSDLIDDLRELHGMILRGERGVQKEEDAVAACLEAARPGDLVILTPTRIEAVWAQIQAFRPAFPSSALGLNAPGVILEPPHG